MYCPNCAQQQVSDEVQYCSRCGLSLANLKEWIVTGGKTSLEQPRLTQENLTPRQKGVRQGALLMLLSVILVPAYILLAALFPADDRLVESAVSDTAFEKISQAVLLTMFLLGLVRFLYARIFQSGSAASEERHALGQMETSSGNHSLPPAPGTPVSGFGAWRETGEIVKSEKQ